MSSNLAFSPISNTFARTVTAASQAISPVISPTPSAAQLAVLGNVDYRFTVVGTQAVWIALAAPTAAAPTAAIPADGANASGIMIEGTMSYTLQLPVGTQIAVIAAAIGSTIYVTIGAGVAL